MAPFSAHRHIQRPHPFAYRELAALQAAQLGKKGAQLAQKGRKAKVGREEKGGQGRRASRLTTAQLTTGRLGGSSIAEDVRELGTPPGVQPSRAPRSRLEP